MQPRLPSSRKWTALPKELATQIQSVFSQSFKDHLKTGRIEADGRIYPEELLLRVGYSGQGRLKQSHFLVSMAYKRDKDNVVKLIHIAVDAAGSLMEQYFATDDDHDFPRVWTEFEFEGRTLYVQYSTVNLQLEAEADRILGQADTDDLAQGDWDEDETPETIKQRLGLDDDDDGKH